MRTLFCGFYKDKDETGELFLGNDRDMAKRHLKLFIERIIITLLEVEIVGKSDMVLAVLENKKIVRTTGILTADNGWLPRDVQL